MKINHYKNKITQILCVIFLIAICKTGIADTAVSAAVDGVYRRAVSAYDHKDYKSALKQFRKMQKEYPMSKHAVRGWEYVAQCENLLGDKYAAFEAYQKIWDNHKDFNKLPTITKNQMTIANDFFEMKRYKIAIEIYNKILENAPYSDFAASAQYSIANALVKREDYYAAKEEFRKLIKNYPMSQFVDDAAYNLGYVDYLQSVGKDYDQTETTQAIIAFRQFIHEFPSSPKVYEAQKYIQKLRNRKAASLFRTGEYYENIRAPKAASISFREVIEQYPDTDYADRARKRIKKINDSKVAKSVQAQQVVKMVRLENQKELARNRDLANRDKIKQNSGQEKQTIQSAVEQTPPSSDIHKSEAEIKKEYANRIKEMYTDPEIREELRLTMKDVYLKEKLSDKKRGTAWKQQELAEQVEPVQLPKQEIAEQNSSESIDDQKETEEQVAAESAEYQRELVKEITSESLDDLNSDGKAEKIADYKPKPVEEIPENFKIEEGKAEQSYNNNQNYSSIDTGDEELSVEYEAVKAPAEDISEVAVEKAEAVEAKPAEDISEVAVEKAETIEAKPAENVPEITVEEAETIETKPIQKIEQKTEVKNIDRANVEQQKRAERVKRMVEYIKKRDKDKKIQTRKLSGVGNVRRAESIKRKDGNSSADLQRQYVPIYYSIQSGDAAFQRGVFSDAKRFYGKALDGLLDIKSKDPEWKSDIVNWRIDHCRKQLEKIK
jgi:outer membrane protein assembly factor BamD